MKDIQQFESKFLVKTTTHLNPFDGFGKWGTPKLFSHVFQCFQQGPLEFGGGRPPFLISWGERIRPSCRHWWGGQHVAMWPWWHPAFSIEPGNHSRSFINHLRFPKNWGAPTSYPCYLGIFHHKPSSYEGTPIYGPLFQHLHVQTTAFPAQDSRHLQTIPDLFGNCSAGERLPQVGCSASGLFDWLGMREMMDLDNNPRKYGQFG